MKLRRVLKWAALLVGVLLVALSVFAYRTFGRVQRPDGATVGIAQPVVLGFSQAFLIDAGDGGVILIDAGMEKHLPQILEALKARGQGPGDVRAILVTHGHADHIGGIAGFPGVPVYAHTAEVPLIRGERDSPAPARKLIPHAKVAAAVTHPVGDGEVVTLGAREVKVFHVPGHTPGSAAYLIDGVLFLGDSASAGKDGKVLPAPWFFSEDTGQNQRELKRLGNRLREQRLSALAFGHSASITGTGLAQLLEAAGE